MEQVIIPPNSEQEGNDTGGRAVPLSEDRDAGLISVHVRGHNVPQGPQNYALVITGTPAGCTSRLH